MKQICKSLCVLLLALVLVLSLGGSAWAEETPPPGAVFTLTYPDGSTVTTTDYAKAKKLCEEWKLLASGSTDRNGELVLPGWAESGKIRIVETQAPRGYVKIEGIMEADLANGGVRIVNQRSSGSSPRTGDGNQPLLWLGLALLSGLGVCADLVRRKRKESKGKH